MLTPLIKRHSVWGLFVIAGFIWGTMAGCSWPRSYLQHSWTIASQFDNHEIYSGYQYYTGGTLEDPRAVVALKPGYKLDSPDWKAVHMTPGILVQWVEALNKDFFTGYNTFPNGARVIGDNGMVAGYYYSAWEFPLVRMPDKKTVQMNLPYPSYRSTNKRALFLNDDTRYEEH